MVEMSTAHGLHLVPGGEQGAGIVVLLHPVGLDLTFWDRQIEVLAGNYQVVAVDLPGHGLSEKVSGGAGDVIADTAGRVVAALDELGYEKVHLIGHSFGGMIALHLAVAAPKRLASLGLLSTASTFSDGTRDFMRGHADQVRENGMVTVLPSIPQWVAETTALRRPDIVDRLEKSVLTTDPDAYAAAWDAIAAFDLLDSLDSIDVPTLVLVGDRDVNTPVSDSVLLEQRIHRAELGVISEASHLITLDSPEQVNARLVSFLATVSSCAR